MKRSRQKYAVALGLVLAVCGSAVAEEKTTQLGEVVVTATRDEVPIEQVGSSITVVTAKEIEQQQKRTVADALRMVPGLDVVRTGGIGGTTSVFMRGAKSEHTLILIDGIEMNDPSHSGGGYDFANLTTENIERIEVLRGPQSTLYGSSAMGGVINIITKKGSGAVNGYASAEGGSFYTSKENLGINGATDVLNYSLHLSRTDSNGISAAAAKNNNPEKDGYRNTSVAARFGLTPDKNFDLDFIFKYLNSRTDIDGGWGLPTDALGSNAKSEEIYFGTQAHFNLFNSFLDQKIGVALNDISREYNAYNSSYDGQILKFDWQSLLHLHKTNDLTLGIERKEESAKTESMQEKEVGTTSVYLQDQISLFDAWFSTLGVRIDDNSRFGTEATYRFTTAYLIKQIDMKLKGSYGTGFKAPSLIQLYHPTWGGNVNLQPEKNVGWDIGLEQGVPLFKSKLSATYFRNDYNDMITGVSNGGVYSYTNVAKAHTHGLELTAALQPVDDLTLKASYTYLETRDDISGKQLVRRPKNKASFDINYSFLKKANVNLGLIYVGTRYANTTNTQKMKDYLLVNLAGSYDITKNLQVFGRVDNLFDRQYEEVAGYGTPGVVAYGGVKVSF